MFFCSCNIQSIFSSPTSSSPSLPILPHPVYLIQFCSSPVPVYLIQFPSSPVPVYSEVCNITSVCSSPTSSSLPHPVLPVLQSYQFPSSLTSSSALLFSGLPQSYQFFCSSSPVLPVPVYLIQSYQFSSPTSPTSPTSSHPVLPVLPVLQFQSSSSPVLHININPTRILYQYKQHAVIYCHILSYCKINSCLHH